MISLDKTRRTPQQRAGAFMAHIQSRIFLNYSSPPFDFRPHRSLGVLWVCLLLLFCAPSSFLVNVSLLATDVLRCWSSSQAGFFFFGCVDEMKKRLKELDFGFVTRSFSLSCKYPPLLIPEDDAGVALLLLLFALLLRKPPKKGILKGFSRSQDIQS